MFLCPKCKSTMNLPVCGCGYTVRREKNVWQLSDMPDMVTDGDGDKYIGYEHIGEAYSGEGRYLIEERDALFAKEVSRLTGDGYLLDLGCGDGCLTVPCAAEGTRIIAGDISNKMLSILQQKAAYNKISLDRVTLCRMNALNIPLCDESVDTVVANSMLHLISNPGKVVSEIYRVLKKGGFFLCRDDRPGVSRSEPFDNTQYNQYVNTLYSEYWTRLGLHHIFPVKYSWKFKREEVCDGFFAQRTERTIQWEKYFETTLEEGFLKRFRSRGFSDQTEVPRELHEEVLKALLTEFQEKYGSDFTDTRYKGIEGDIVITIYTK